MEIMFNAVLSMESLCDFVVKRINGGSLVSDRISGYLPALPKIFVILHSHGMAS
jgi:hypothetical protein